VQVPLNGFDHQLTLVRPWLRMHVAAKPSAACWIERA
jgi:hypothetical protein